MHMFLAALGTETNTFSPVASGRSHWADSSSIYRTEGMVACAGERDWTVTIGPMQGSHPGGITPRTVYESMREDILGSLKACERVDAVLLILHGAMVAEGYPDCEGDLISCIRDQVGPDVPIGVELDLHAHMTILMQEKANLLVGYKEYPHTDVEEQLIALFHLLADTSEGKINPVTSVFECQMIHLYPTTVEPLQSFVKKLRGLEEADDILNVWICHGFPWGDVPEAGARLVVTTDGDQALADRLSRDLGLEFYNMRGDVARQTGQMRALIDEALTLPGPVTIADTADNPGGGAPCDSTFALQDILDSDANNCALGPLFDPGAVEICFDAGEGATIQLRIGGKTGPTSGAPMDVTATVLSLAEKVMQSLGNTLNTSLGRCAAIRLQSDNSSVDEAGIDIVLSEKRAQAFATNLFTDLGIDPTTKQILVVKSTQHFYASFAPISPRVLYAGDKGALQGDVLTIPYMILDTSRLWPFVDDPLATQHGTNP